ncbi:MAG: phosphopantothenoylcysteine decarboxylase [Verrucomicrobiota bacterium]
MKILITCGPGYEPIDGARRLTNFSTGTLGVTLANHFARLHHDVLCLKGEGATCPEPLRGPRLESFATNDDLARRLERASQREPFDAVLHAAALCDYRVDHVLNGEGSVIRSEKFATRDGRLMLVLAPATKVLPRLREWFPNALIAGWKYELAGTRDDALAKAWLQMDQNRTDACVLNGAAYGNGFAFCESNGGVQPCPDKNALGACLEAWLERAKTFRLCKVSRPFPTNQRHNMELEVDGPMPSEPVLRQNVS